MSSRARARALLLAGVAAAGAPGCQDRRRPGLEYMPDMAHSLPYDSFAANPNTRDGKTLQAPVAGTVPRGFLPLRYGTSPAEAERAGRELHDPALPADPERGRRLYTTFCFVCHGEQGLGDGPLASRIPPPTSFASDRVRRMPAGQIYHVITYGSGRMPSYAAQVQPAERWLIAREVRWLGMAAEPAR
jgi:mono/diheme cytochrome c family protein